MKLASQVFSSSVAKSLELDRELEIPAFQDVVGTIHFIRAIDRLFDTLNSRSSFAKGYKAPISSKNFRDVTIFLKSVIDMICTLEICGRPLLSTNKATGFTGFLLCISSLQRLIPLWTLLTLSGELWGGTTTLLPNSWVMLTDVFCPTLVSLAFLMVIVCTLRITKNVLKSRFRSKKNVRPPHLLCRTLLRISVDLLWEVWWSVRRVKTVSSLWFVWMLLLLRMVTIPVPNPLSFKNCRIVFPAAALCGKG